MNERIRELMEQAGGFYLPPNAELNKPEHIFLEDEQVIKFAGLIVAECMEVFSKDLPEPGDGKMLEVINRMCNVAEHFGVEQ